MQRKLFTLIILVATVYLTANRGYSQRIVADSLKAHVYYLASDQLQGRAPGTKGEKLAQQYIIRKFESIGLKPLGQEGYLQPFAYRRNLNPHDTTARKSVACKGSNVIGYLDNGAAYTLVIGAHYDHLGHGESGSPLEKKGKKKVVFNGADDNASGVAGVIELARYFSGNDRKEAFNLLFICFSAEEDGLIGSKFFTRNPTADLGTLTAMINMDMIGRLSDSSRSLMVYGTGTHPGFPEMLNRHNPGFKLVQDSSGSGPSDHASFYQKNIPVLHFFTGQHSDYHKSGDDAEKCNYPGSAAVLDYVITLCEHLPSDQKLAFTQTKQKEMGRGGFKVTMGIMPDYTFEGKGLRIDGVTEGKPAQKAGIRTGDILVQLGETRINTIREYMGCLSTLEKGQRVKAILLRDGKEVETEVLF